MAHSIKGGVLLLPILLAGSCSLSTFAPPESESHEVDFAEALDFALLAEAAYLTEDEIQDRYPDRRLVTGDVPASDVRYLVLFDDDARTQDISIRGTSNLENVRVDVEFIPDPDDTLGLYLHSGFARAGKELYERIRNDLDQDYATTATGHSLGGAAAVILSLYLQADGYDVTAVRTFGQPKVTNLGGARRTGDLPIIRFVNGTDPVPDLPPLLVPDLAWAYTHFGPQVILWGEDRYIYLESFQALWAGGVSFWTNLGDHEIVEHQMESYVKSLQGLQAGSTEIRFAERGAFPPDAPR